LEWLRKRGRATKERIVVSKYYVADEAATHTPVWWFEFLASHATNEHFLNLLCQVAPNSSEFRHLRVPMEYFRDQERHLGSRADKFSLYLSAEKPRLFRELRGDGSVDFGAFEVR
jgi:hypothetical protein